MDYQGDAGYGGGGGFETGGGFSATQGGGGGGGRRNYDEQTVIPVTARMILTAKNDPSDNNVVVLEDDRKLNQIKLVGAVRSLDPQSTTIGYTIEDGTGLVEVKQWLDENQDCTAAHEIRQAAMQEHIYVRVIGKIKEYQGARQIVAEAVYPLTTGNQLAHHFLEVVYSGEKFKNASSIVQPTSPMDVSGSNGIGFGASSGGMRAPVMQQAGTGDTLRDSVLNFIRDVGGKSILLFICWLFLLFNW